MENAPEPGQGKKPRSKPTSRPAATRKPSTAKKPPAKKPPAKRPTPAQPRPKPPAAAKPVVDEPISEPIEAEQIDVEQVEAEQIDVEQVDAVAAEQVEDEQIAAEQVEVETILTDVEEPLEESVGDSVGETVEEAVESMAEVAADEPADEIAGEPETSKFTLPRLTMPKLTIPRLGRKQPAVEEVVDEAANVVETVDSEPEVVESADESATDDAATDEAETESGEAEPDEAKPDEAEPEAEVDEAEPETDDPEVIDPEVIEAELIEDPAPAQEVSRKKKVASDVVLLVEGLSKSFDDVVAVDSIDLEVTAGAFYGIVGPNGAGKTTTLSMITGLLRPDSGTVAVHGADVWSDPVVAKRNMGVLPDRLRLFDRLTGAQLLHYAGVLRGLDGATVRSRTADLAGAFGLEDALGRLVSDYSAGMTKKIALAAAMIHSPRLLVLDEPFESVDPVSAATVTDILKSYAKAGGTVVLSSHSMDLVQRICDHVAVIVGGRILANGTVDEVRDGQSLEQRFVELAGGRKTVEGLEWLHSFSD